MSLGSTYNNNQNNDRETNKVSVYSNYSFANPDSTVDASRLGFRFWSGMLCITIAPKKNTGNDKVEYDRDNGITIYLPYRTADILKRELQNFLKDPVKYNCCGVPSGQAVITISNGIEYGKNSPVLTIRKVSESGEVVSAFAYEFKTDINYSIRNYDGRNFDTVHDDYRNLEIEHMIILLDEFVKAMTNAIAYSVVDRTQFTDNKIENKLNAIMDKLGIEQSSGYGNRRTYSNNSYFNQAAQQQKASGSSAPSAPASYGSATLDDLE